jgi:ATP adenylyltransferase
MDHLWAPWRMSYVAAPKPSQPKTDHPDDCFLCRGLSEANDRANLIVSRTTLSTVVLNRFPYNNGHLLIAPFSHKATLADLTTAELLDLQETLRTMIGRLEKLMTPDGFNVGLNLGRAAGAGLPGHLHWHIVPRWNGDTNFMPVFTDTRVIVQSLDALYSLLTEPRPS